MRWLDTERILATPPAPGGAPIGRSREGRPIDGYRFGSGPVRISLIGGCHADEPVGPEMLRRLAGWLGSGGARRALAGGTWQLVPHVNPDGAQRNATWSSRTVATVDFRGEPDRGFDLAAYLAAAKREPPGDDVEFGFPRGPADTAARPENRAVARFMAAAGPFHLHASLHGMAFAPGPWFLLEPAWIDRTGPLRAALRRRVRRMGYTPYDVDRGGEKGFVRIDEGFSTRPDSRAMAAHFEQRGDAATAALFRPSSMELARSLGGDPLTFVSEMPLFLVHEGGKAPAVGGDAGERLHFRAWLEELARGVSGSGLRRQAAATGIRPMPIGDQMRLQLAFLEQGLRAVTAAPGTPPAAATPESPRRR